MLDIKIDIENLELSPLLKHEQLEIINLKMHYQYSIIKTTCGVFWVCVESESGIISQPISVRLICLCRHISWRRKIFLFLASVIFKMNQKPMESENWIGFTLLWYESNVFIPANYRQFLSGWQAIYHFAWLPADDEDTTSYHSWYSKTHSSHSPLYRLNIYAQGWSLLQWFQKSCKDYTQSNQ